MLDFVSLIVVFLIIFLIVVFPIVVFLVVFFLIVFFLLFLWKIILIFSRRPLLEPPPTPPWHKCSELLLVNKKHLKRNFLKPL